MADSSTLTYSPSGFTTDDSADGLCIYLDASPSPFHACETTAAMLDGAGFTRLDETDAWPTGRGRYYLVRGGSLIAWSTEHAADAASPLRLIGAHTDSPNLRVKPRPDLARAGWQLLGVEVYGGALESSWLDRDLGLSGRVAVRGAHGIQAQLLRVDDPVLRVSQLAPHLDRSVRTDGLKLNAQQHMAPHWGLGEEPGDFIGFVADQLDVAAEDVLGWDLMTHDLTPARRTGLRRDTVAGARQDNLATSYAATRALIAAVDVEPVRPTIQAIALFDHEEVGSVSERGAASSLLMTTLERMTASLGGSREDLHRSIAGGVIASGDMAHATHPNYADRHEPQHTIAMNGGPVLKTNTGLKYATDGMGGAAFRLACEQAGVPCQDFVMRSDLPCGSTVGPITSALTGGSTVDFGAPTLSMHSTRELTGAEDQAMYAAALACFLSPA
ncbi:M18 family aminopeptidase [Luteipulveratus sp. YIM 133132]|uniref:M18 family aminopeptidase n=1 Tax=Luteipulveratus flavus TaxID=3031728 RepID=UPI0023B120DB|nr:M18 family aminopeptidase [Luteipulveratus sp. YIM 133132]MDE9367333.1 M18 family aminopeptidase [Luteipulveratus sp. YIM 133132]